MLLRDATLQDGSRADVRIAGETIDAVSSPGRLGVVPDEEVHELAGYVVLPAMAEPHAHLDKAFTAARVVNTPGNLIEAIETWSVHRATVSVEDVAVRARAGALLALARGATAIRSHVDVGEGIGLRAVEALLQVREELRASIDIQVVALAFPLTGRAGVANRALLREALAMGVDVVGGAPHVDPDPRAHLDACLALAAEYGRPVDLHMDEHMRSEGLDLAEMAAVVGCGFAPGAVASHCVSLGVQPPDVQARVSAAVAAAGIAVVVLPQTNLYLQARGIETAQPRGITALPALLRAGATVAGGGDNVQDPFNPLGCCDPLQTAQLLVVAGQLAPADAYGLVSDGARRAMGLAPVRVEPGFPAELVAIAGASLAEVVATATEDRIVIRAGRVRACTRVFREVIPLDGRPTLAATSGPQFDRDIR